MPAVTSQVTGEEEKKYKHHLFSESVPAAEEGVQDRSLVRPAARPL